MPYSSVKKSNNPSLKNFFSKHKKIVYKKNQLILQSEDSPQGVYYVIEGFVRVYVISENGSELTFNIFTSGSFFPMFWAINNTANGYYFEAMSTTVVYRAPRKEFLSFIHRESLVMNQINELVLHSLSSTLIRLQYLVLGNATQRVACVLIMLVRRFGKMGANGCRLIAFRVTQQQIAHLTALTRESVSIVLRKFEKEKLIRRDQWHYVILHFPLLLKKSSFYIDGKPLPYTY